MNRPVTIRLIYSALCLSFCFVLPFMTGQIPVVGKMLCPMHFPVLLCGFLCGWQYGVAVGVLAPLLRSLFIGMPPLYPTAVGMTFELATYGFLCGWLYRLLPKKLPFYYLALISAMLGGRAVWGVSRYVMAGLSGSAFPFSAFVSGAFAEAFPGILLQLLLIPPVLCIFRRQKLMPGGSVKL